MPATITATEPSALALRRPQLDAARAALAQAEASLADAELELLAEGRARATAVALDPA